MSLWLAAFLSVPAAAEFHRIDQSVAALDCASCIGSIRTRIGRMRGVASVEVDEDARLVRVALQPDNRVRLEAVRDVIKGVGFTPTQARVRVRGKASQNADGWQFQPEGLDQIWRLVVAANQQLPAGQTVVLEGIAPPVADPRQQPVLEVTAVDP